MWFALTLSGIVFVVVLHGIFARLGGSLTIVLSFLCVSAPIAIIILFIAYWMFGISDESAAAILVYLAFCETYIFLFTLVANSVSISILMRLKSNPTTADKLMESYSTQAMVERRIDQLRAANFLTESAGQVRLLPRGEILAQVFVIARNLFRHPPLRDG